MHGKKEKPALTEKDERDITFDDFTYALHDETKELTKENKAKLLEMAKFFKEQQEKEKDKQLYGEGCFTEVTDLYDDLQNVGATLCLYPIGFVDAATLEMNKQYAVFVDPSYFSTVMKMKEAIAHEIGHCATGCTHKVSSPLDLVAKHEYKANRWAIEKYLPFEAINSAMKKGCTEPWELADYFNVSEEFIRKAIRYYTGPRGKHFE